MKKLFLYLLIFVFASFCSFSQNYSLQFDGSNDYVDCGADVTSYTAISLEAWVYVSSYPGAYATFISNCRHDASTEGYELSIWADGRASIHLGSDWTVNNHVYTSASIPLNTWTHIAGTWDNASNDLKIYVNGSLDNTANWPGGSIVQPGNLYIGGRQNETQFYFNGYLDEVRVWNDVRSAGEILTYGCGGLSDYSNLVAYYRMNDGSGTSLAPTNSGNTGTISGAAWSTNVVTPAITGQPSASSTICTNQSTSFTVTASGPGLSYQWQVDVGSGFNNLGDVGVYSGTSTNQITITNPTAGMNSYAYRCVVSGVCGPSATSNTSTLYVNSPPSTTNPGTPPAVCSENGTATFTVVGSGTGISYQWWENDGGGWNTLGAGGGVYSGTQSASLVITDPPYSMNTYTYRCVVSGTCNPAATSNPATLTVYPVPTVSATTAVTTSVSGGGSVYSVSVNSGGNISALGGSTVNEHGICWDVNSSPTIADSKTTQGATGTGAFSSTITGFLPNTLYYVRAYATTSNGCTVYGPEVSFTSPKWTILSKSGGNSVLGPGGSTGGGSDDLKNLTLTYSSGNDYSLSYNYAPDNCCWSNSIGTMRRAFFYNGSWSIIQDINVGASGPYKPTYQSSSITTTINPASLNAGTYYYRVSMMDKGAGGDTWGANNYACNSCGTSGSPYRHFDNIDLKIVLSNNTPPLVTTTSITTITQSSVFGTGNITNTGSATVTDRGFEFRSDSTGNGELNQNGSFGTGAFTGTVSSLVENTKYWVSAYAENSGGRANGTEFEIVTLPDATATTAVTSITRTTATSGSTVSRGGGNYFTARGVCWNTTGSPTTADDLTDNNDNTWIDATSGATNTAATNLTTLTPNTLYYVRGFVTNAAGTDGGGGTDYAPQVTFTTLADATATTAVSSIAETTATSGGNINVDGGQNLTAYGVCWNTTGTPTVADSKTTQGAGAIPPGAFVSNMTGLTNNTKYYVRSYATNAGGTSYGPEVFFTTKVNCYTSNITGVTHNSGSVSGAFAVAPATAGGTETISERGWVWSNSNNPPTTTTSLSSFKQTSGINVGQIGPTTLDFPLPSTTYYLRTYAINDGGLNYGNLVTFTTSQNAPQQGTESISLNFDHTGGNWIDNNSDNTDPSVPSGGTIPTNNNSDGNFPQNTNNGGSGNWNTWSFNGTNQSFYIPYNTASGRLNNNSQKFLSVYFRASNVSSRQIILELGGLTSGLNIFIYQNKINFGIWNSSQRRFFSKTISTGTNYMATLEYNGSRVRTSLNGIVSSSMEFSGFNTNINNNGVGASNNGTRYMDITSGTGVTHFYSGTLAEVLMYNNCSQSLREEVIDFYDAKYGTSFASVYTGYFGKATGEDNSDFEVFTQDVSPMEEARESNMEVYQSTKTLMINLNASEEQAVEMGIYNVSGELMGKIFSGNVKTGINTFEYLTENLVTGIYFIKAEGLSINEAAKVMIVK